MFISRTISSELYPPISRITTHPKQITPNWALKTLEWNNYIERYIYTCLKLHCRLFGNYKIAYLFKSMSKQWYAHFCLFMWDFINYFKRHQNILLMYYNFVLYKHVYREMSLKIRVCDLFFHYKTISLHKFSRTINTENFCIV